jgi:hypothetical protein
MSAFAPIADIVQRHWHVRLVPQGDICSAAKEALFDHLVGEGEHLGRKLDAQRLCSLEDWRPICDGSTPVRWRVCAQYDLRTARRVWRTVVLATQTPPTRVLPGPQAAAAGVIKPSG